MVKVFEQEQSYIGYKIYHNVSKLSYSNANVKRKIYVFLPLSIFVTLSYLKSSQGNGSISDL